LEAVGLPITTLQQRDLRSTTGLPAISPSSEKYLATVDRGVPARAARPETETAFVVTGASVRDAVLVNDGGPIAELPIMPDLNAVFIPTPLTSASATLLLRFDNLVGTILAALLDYVTYVDVLGDRIVSVTYVPTLNNPLRGFYDQPSNAIAKLQSVVSTSAAYGVFGIQGTLEQREQAGLLLLRQISRGGVVDPTLALHAAYALSDADLPDQVRALRAALRDTLRGVELFDIVMLSRSAMPAGGWALPYCPMISRGWNDVEVSRMPVGSLVAGTSRRSSPWTVFDPFDAGVLIDAARRGLIP
jgi:hypothetical protein